MDERTFILKVKPGEEIEAGQILLVSDETLEAEVLRTPCIPKGFTGAVAVDNSRDGNVRAARTALKIVPTVG